MYSSIARLNVSHLCEVLRKSLARKRYNFHIQCICRAWYLLPHQVASLQTTRLSCFVSLCAPGLCRAVEGAFKPPANALTWKLPIPPPHQHVEHVHVMRVHVNFMMCSFQSTCGVMFTRAVPIYALCIQLSTYIYIYYTLFVSLISFIIFLYFCSPEVWSYNNYKIIICLSLIMHMMISSSRLQNSLEYVSTSSQ